MGIEDDMELMSLCDCVEDEATFIRFVKALAADFEDSRGKENASPTSPYSPAANGWENTTINAFLDAATAWAHDSQTETSNPWKRAAQMLMAGKIYE
jgi:hypothetical protein